MTDEPISPTNVEVEIRKRLLVVFMDRIRADQFDDRKLYDDRRALKAMSIAGDSTEAGIELTDTLQAMMHRQITRHAGGVTHV